MHGANHATPDPFRQLQAAARRCGRHALPGVAIGRVVILDANGKKVVDLAIPPDMDSHPEPLANTVRAAPAPRPGWDFSGPTPRFDGTDVPIHGRKADLLRVLAEKNGPATVDDLRAAWDGYQVEEGTVRWTVGELRKALRELFPGLEGEPVTSGPGGYVLVIR